MKLLISAIILCAMQICPVAAEAEEKSESEIVAAITKVSAPPVVSGMFSSWVWIEAEVSGYKTEFYQLFLDPKQGFPKASEVCNFTYIIGPVRGLVGKELLAKTIDSAKIISRMSCS